MQAKGSYVAVPQRRGVVHAVASEDRGAGTVKTACGRSLRVKADSWSGEAPYRTGWDWEVDCRRCRSAHFTSRGRAEQ